MPPYIAPYRGRDRGVPAGFMQAASLPGQLIGDGVARAMESINAGLQRRHDEAKAEHLEGKAADALFKALSLRQVPGINLPDPTVFANAGAREKAAWGRGVTAAMALAEQGQGMQQRQTAAQQGAERHQEFMRQAGVSAQLDQRRASQEAGMDKFAKALQARTALPSGQTGPVQPMDADTVLSALVESGQLMNPQADNMLNALSRLNAINPRDTAAGRVGTITALPNGQQFLWMTPNSGKALETPTAGVADNPPPPGHSVWVDNTGKQHLVKLPQAELPAADQLKARTLAHAKSRLEQLRALQMSGAQRFTEDRTTGVLNKGGWWWNDSVADEIERTTAMVANLERELSETRKALAPPAAAQQPPANQQAPAAAPSFDDFQQWMKGRK